jgi:hypothetical protein
MVCPGNHDMRTAYRDNSPHRMQRLLGEARWTLTRPGTTYRSVWATS